MYIADAHCDVLYKMFIQPDINFYADERLDVHIERLVKSGYKLQLFAIYIPENCNIPKFEYILQMIDIFHNKICSHSNILKVENKKDLAQLMKSDQIGAMLTLEGVEGLEGFLPYLRQISRLGVRSVGITWNHANWAADGVLEPRQGGLTQKGFELVQECNRLGITIDVSHLCERSFWDVLEHSSQIIASHSNVFEICPHVRNLKQKQIDAIIQCNGRIGITFVPWFLRLHGKAEISDILSHIDFIGSRGGARHIAFGSDFDGFNDKATGLEDPRCYEQIYELLLSHYDETLVEGFLWKNWFEYFENTLPST